MPNPSAAPFGRLVTAMVTPMTSDGAIDTAGVAAVVEHLLATGHDGLVVNGTTGEASTLSAEESIAVVEQVVSVAAGRASVVAGIGSNDTRHAIEMAARATAAGATGLLLASPYYNKPTQAGLIAHCQAVADSAELPIMLYDIPGRTAIPFATETLIELARHPRIVAVKDAKGDAWETSRVLAATDLAFYAGVDEDLVAWLALGAVGVVSVAAHVSGREFAQIIAAVDAGDLATARAIHARLIPIIGAIMRTSQGAIMAKAALAQLGVIDSATVRLPYVESPPEDLTKLTAALSASEVTR